jgi:hypothetical protein
MIKQTYQSVTGLENVYFRKGECARDLYVSVISNVIYLPPEVVIEGNFTCIADDKAALVENYSYPGFLPECIKCLTGACSDLKSKRVEAFKDER